MDFTALELALRNRQLLQVKCFLKIQIETFRFVLAEELNNSLPSEQSVTLEKFFLHDWQNVVNKIFSVATMQMSGDYSAKIFATLLYRSLIHSNNQLILIVSSILDENANDVFVRSVSPLSISSSTSNSNQLIVVKEKILSILMKQITSIRDNLSKIQGPELSASTELKLTGSDEDSIELEIENLLKIDSSDKISISNGKFQQLFENCLAQDCIPLFSWMVKKYSESFSVEKQLNTKNQLQWQNIVERIANFVTGKIRFSDDINIETIKSYLVQTGIPDFDLLFALFIQTSDSVIRHKLLQMFAKFFTSSEANTIDDNHLSIENFGQYFQTLSIIDMYIYIFRSKLLHDEQMELSIEWLVENRSERILTKSFLLPVLDEIAVNPDLFTEWEELTGNFYNHDYFDSFRKNIFIQENFDKILTPETLWQYLIDNNELNSILNWIQNYTKTLPFCSEIKPINLETCQQMMEYLGNQSPLMLRYETFGALISNPYFFNQHDFQSLIGTICTFENFLTLIGQTGIVNQEKESHLILERLLNKVIKLLPLIEYCIDNRLFEFLFLLYNRYKIDFDVLVSTNHQFNQSDTLVILKFLSGLCSINDEILEDNVFEKSFFIHRFLNGNDENHYSFQDNIIYMLHTIANQENNLDLIIFILSFAHTETFDDFSRILKQLHNNDAEQLVKIFLNKLNSKFPLIYRVFNDNIVNCDMIEYNLPSLPSNSLSIDDDCFCNIGQPSYYNIYTFLQEAIPFVNISKVFQWQIKKLKKQHSNAAAEITLDKDQTEDNNELPHFFQKKLTVYGLKSNLTASYYLKNFRLIQAFIAYNIIPSEDGKHIGGTRELRGNLLNEKLAIKAIKKSAIIAYSSTKDDSVITSCLLFQSLIKSCLNQTINSKSTVNESLRKNINNECEKFCLHLALGRLIIEYASDFLDLQNVQQQQSVLASLLRRSHFHSDPACSQKLLDLSTIAIERKYSFNSSSSQTKLSSNEQKKFLVDVKLFSLFFDALDNETESNPFSKSIINSSMLVIECFEWKPLFTFANYYSLKKPMNFFNKCTREDNWLMLTIFIQLYEIPKEEVQLLLSEATFNNQCIGEHLAKAFQSSRHVNVSNLSETESRILKSKQLPNTSRNDLYSKLFKEKHPFYSATSTPIQSTPIQIESHFPESKNLTFSPNNSNSTDSPETQSLLSISMFSSRINDENISNTCVVLPQKLSYTNASKDFLQLILDIYQNCTLYSHRISDSSFSVETSFQLSLLYASVSLSNPILTFLACSVQRIQTKQIDIGKSFDETLNTSGKKNLSKVNDTVNLGRLKYLSLACWILARVDPRLKQSYIDWYCENNLVEPNDNSLVDCFTNWSPERLLQLINVLTSNDAKSFQVILHGLKMFEINIPIINVLLKFLISFLIMKDYFQTDDLLQFQSLLIKYNEEEFIQSNGLFFQDESNDFLQEAEWSITEFYTRTWIEKCSLIIITNSLLIVKQFELNILLSHYNFIRIQDNFSMDIHRVPDLRKIYLFSQCLNKVPNYTLPIAELLLVERTYGDAESHYGEVFSKLIFDLQESGHFEVARNIINLLTDTNTNDFIINEWMLKAKQAELDNDVITTNIDISFLENCWLQVSKLDPTMHSAFKVMERFVQQLNSNQILIKCFVLLKCLVAIESILKDYSENEKDLNLSPNFDDNSTVCSSTISNNSDLIQDYFNFEVSLWKSVLECEFSIQTTLQNNNVVDNDLNSEHYLQCKNSNFNLTWQYIWKEIVSYFNSSIISKIILPKLNERHPYLYKNVENQRKKQIILLEVFKHEALNTVIQNLLDYFSYVKAKEVSKLFNYVHEDFEIIEACDQTARDILKDISDSPISVQLKKKNKINLVSNISSCNFNPAQRKIISMLETFTNFATIGQKYCEYILLQYKIACYLGKTYSELKDGELNSVELFEMLISANQSESNESIMDDLQSEDGLINDSVSFSTSHISLIDRYMETIMCAKEFIRVVGRVDDKLNDEEKIVNLLAQFVFQNVQQIVERQFGNDGIDTDRIYGQNPMEIELDRTELQFYSARFSILIRLLRDPCLLGHKLLELAKKSKSAFENTFTEFWDENETQFIIAKRKHYVQMVELYIRAHECFQCDVGGIALVLRKTRFLITTELKPARYFHLILRLLTGIGRYSEMTYCFDLFRECDRFELILSKRVQRTPQLRIALLNYLKNAEHIEELLPLVAIRFFLYRETADQHCLRAEKMLKEINLSSLFPILKNSYGRSITKKISSASLVESVSSSPSFNLNTSLINLPSFNAIKEQLETIMYEFQEAEANYTKAALYANADHCSRKAQLIAVQLYYLNKFKCNESMAGSFSVSIVINLDSNQVKDFINQCNNYFEAFIVSKSYPEVNIEWADPFFNNAIINNNNKYVVQFLEINEITVPFLEKLIKHFELFVTLFHQQNAKFWNSSNIGNKDPNNSPYFSPSSPLQTSFLAALMQIRSETDLQKVYLSLEQIIETILCDNNKGIKIGLIDKYRLAKKLNSTNLIKRLLESNHENYAYLLDLKMNKKL